MSSVDQELHAYADLFLGLHDELPRDAVRDEGASWLADSGLWSLSQLFASDVEQGRPIGGFLTRLNSRGQGERRDRRIFAALRGLDTAFRHVHPTATARAASAEQTPRAMMRLQAYVAAAGRLDSGRHRHGGALLPRLAAPLRSHGEPDDKRDLFDYVVRVPEDTWKRVEFTSLGEARRLQTHELAAGITLATVPVIADPNELRLERRAARSAYRIAPADAPATLTRIEEIVAALDRSGAIIGMAPELTLTPALLERWQACLAAPGRRTRLRWVLAGTGPLSSRGGRPTNTAVLLDGRTGDVIAGQDKQHAFDFTAEELARWGLADRLGSEPLSEDIARGKRLTIVDAGAARVAILVCEDLGRVVEVGPLLRDVGVSLILVPVFGRPIKQHRWEQQAAAVHVRTIGASVVVANSLVVKTITQTDGGTTIVVPAYGQALVGEATGAADIAVFRLLADGSAEHA